MSTPQPAYSNVNAAAVDSGASHVAMGHYSPVHMSENTASLEVNRRGSKASAPPSGQPSASTYYSAQSPGSNNFSHDASAPGMQRFHNFRL
jgi:hypothetical protein